ncbi:MAG: hypothetical protein IT331_02945 [Anaerolineae bacterium]|nr:hypothetical protein [Anaerolineae bacterium]
MAFKVGDRVRFMNLGKFKRRPLFPPPAVGTPHTYEGELGTVVYVPEADKIAVRPDGKEHAHGAQAGWVFRPEELEIVTDQ